MNLYELALVETKSVLDEWLTDTVVYQALHKAMAEAIVDRLIAKGAIQSTDPDELTEPTGYVTPVHPPRAANERPT